VASFLLRIPPGHVFRHLLLAVLTLYKSESQRIMDILMASWDGSAHLGSVFCFTNESDGAILLSKPHNRSYPQTFLSLCLLLALLFPADFAFAKLTPLILTSS
jgi:hypothetical protein